MLSVGGILNKQRLNKGLSLKQVEKLTKIREPFLKAVEENNWNHFSSKIYIKGIIKNYSRILDLDETKMLAFFRREYEKKEEVHFKTKVENKYLTSDSKKILFFLLVCTFVFFGLYFAVQLRQFLLPPKVVLLEPTGTKFKRVPKIKIIGKTEKESTILYQSERIYQNKEGIFEIDFPLTQAKNNFVIEVTGANGKKTVFTKEFTKTE